MPLLGKDYFLPLQQANDALTALSATLTDQQRALLDSYEDTSAARRQPPIRTPTPAGPSSAARELYR